MRNVPDGRCWNVARLLCRNLMQRWPFVIIIYMSNIIFFLSVPWRHRRRKKVFIDVDFFSQQQRRLFAWCSKAVFSTKICAFEGLQAQKKRILLQRWRAVGGGSLHPGWCRLTSWRWWRWYVLSQRVILLWFWGCILTADRVILYRCIFVPMEGGRWRAGTGTDGGRAGGRREAGGRRYPPHRFYGWDDKGGWNAEIFFRVWGALVLWVEWG